MRLRRDHRCRTFFASMLEQLASASILRDRDGGRALVFERRFRGLVDESPVAGMYSDRRADDREYGEAEWLLEDLRKAVAAAVPADNRIAYEISFDNGINLQNDEHISYLRRILDDVCIAGIRAIDTARQSPALCTERDRLSEESSLHLAFAAERAGRFAMTGPSLAALSRVKEYLGCSGGQAMVVHGPSGAGKTYVMAKAAAHWAEVMRSRSAMVVRFLGTSQDSATVALLLTSVCQQLRAISMGREAYVAGSSSASDELGPVPGDFDALCTYFKDVLIQWKWGPLLLLLDSVDQLDDSNAGRRLEWLPFKFSDQVHFHLQRKSLMYIFHLCCWLYFDV
jgi:hypothetical protein